MPIEIVGMAPLLAVFDMPTSLAFYRDKLGFSVTGDSGQGNDSGWVMLELAGTTIMLNTAYDDGERPTELDTARIAAHSDACLYFGCPNVDAAYEHLRSEGIEAKPPTVAAYGMKQLYIEDPDGYGICFQWSANGE